MNDLRAVPLDLKHLAPYARVIPVDTSRDHPEELWQTAVASARAELGPVIEIRSVDAPAADQTVAVLEIHHRSPQLTVCVDADWVLTILVADVDPQLATAADLVAYTIPPGTPILLSSAVWHGPVAPLSPTRVEIAFSEGVLDATDVVRLAEPVRGQR